MPSALPFWSITLTKYRPLAPRPDPAHPTRKSTRCPSSRRCAALRLTRTAIDVGMPAIQPAHRPRAWSHAADPDIQAAESHLREIFIHDLKSATENLRPLCAARKQPDVGDHIHMKNQIRRHANQPAASPKSPDDRARSCPSRTAQAQVSVNAPWRNTNSICASALVSASKICGLCPASETRSPRTSYRAPLVAMRNFIDVLRRLVLLIQS